ncbi:MAG: PAS domain S-box protein, partial [Methanoregula sp.]
MDPIDELKNLLIPVLVHAGTEDAERIEKSLQRIRKHADLQEKKINRATLDRQAVHALMKRTSDDLIRRYQTLFEQDNNAKAVVEKNGTISLANTSFCNLIKERREDVENKKNICDYLDDTLRDSLLEGNDFQKEAKVPSTLSGQVHTAGGESVDVLISFSTFPESSQKIVTLVDISERIKLERKVMETSAFLSGILRVSPVGFHMTDTEGKYVYVNETWSAITGYSEGEALGKAYSIILHPDDRDRVITRIKNSTTEKEAQKIVCRVIRPDGTVCWTFNHVVPVIDTNGQVTGWVGAVNDITERKKIENELRENRAYLETLFTSVQVGIVVIDAETHRILDANPAALATIGLEKQEVTGRVCHRFICPTEAGRCPVTDLGQHVDNSERVLVNARGERVPIIKYVIPVMLHGKKCLLETFIDNTYRKKMKAALIESEEKYRAFTEKTGDIIYSMDLAGNFTYISPQVEKYHFSPGEVIGRPFWSFVHPADIEPVRKSLDALSKKSDLPTLTFRALDKNGNLRWLEGKSSVRLDPSGKPAGYMGILRDVTDRKHVEDAIALANKKLNLMNDITRHDVLNTITGVYGCIDMANATASAKDRADLLREVKNQVAIIQGHISFTKQYQEVGIHVPQWQKVADVIDHVIPNFIHSGIAFKTDLEGIEVYADPLLEKVFYNLIDNAVRYGTTLTTILVHGEVTPGGMDIIFEDDGVGVPVEDK